MKLTLLLLLNNLIFSLNICKDKWYNQLDAQINIQNLILPYVR